MSAVHQDDRPDRQMGVRVVNPARPDQSTGPVGRFPPELSRPNVLGKPTGGTGIIYHRSVRQLTQEIPSRVSLYRRHRRRPSPIPTGRGRILAPSVRFSNLSIVSWLREGSGSASAGPFSLSTDLHPCKPGYLPTLLKPATRMCSGVCWTMRGCAGLQRRRGGVRAQASERNLGDVFLGLSAHGLTYLVHAPDSSLQILLHSSASAYGRWATAPGRIIRQSDRAVAFR
jgi:hypothetical protein